MKKIIASLSLLALFLPLISLAHPGHGETDGYTITHYFVEPIHIVFSVGVLIAVVAFVRLLEKNKQQKENS
jgi:hypothetical protein